MKIGVLALQGGFAEHQAVLETLGVEVAQVRLPQHLAGLDGLIIPGGESTTIGRLAVDFDLMQPLRLAEVSRNLGEAMVGRQISAMPEEEKIATRGW